MMSRRVPVDRLTSDHQTLQRLHSLYRDLAARLAGIGFIWRGSITERWLTCGRADCECAKDPRARHGPYLYWTSKEKGRSVARLLHPPESDILQEWVNNRKEMDGILRQMYNLSHKAFKVALRARKQQMGKPG
jgi:hypothetical protein